MTYPSTIPPVQTFALTKSFGEGELRVTVLNKVNLTVEHGEFLALMGPSGSGKSTLLYLLGGLEFPSEGRVEILGRDLSRLSDREMSRMRRRDMGFVFQFFNLIPELSAEDNIRVPLLLEGGKVTESRERLDSLLEAAGLTRQRHLLPREMSGGQQQRTALIRALMPDPALIFADEPTGNLDSRSGREVLELLKRVNRTFSKTIVMVTHSPEAARYADRVVYLKDGQMEEHT